MRKRDPREDTWTASSLPSFLPLPPRFLLTLASSFFIHTFSKSRSPVMAFLQQISGFGALERSSPSILIGSPFRSGNGRVFDGRGIAYLGSRGFKGRRLVLRVVAAKSSSSPYKMNLNEYMVTLEKPLGIRFALSADGKIFVHAIKKGVFQFSLSTHV